MLVLKALSRTCGMSRHTLPYWKVHTVTQRLKHHLSRRCSSCCHDCCEDLHVSGKTAACQILTVRSGHQVASSSSIIGSVSSSLLRNRFTSASSFERLQLHPLISSAPWKQTECIAPERRKNYRKSTFYWHIPNIRNFHTSFLRKDIPEYLYGNVSEVRGVENDLYDEELEEDLYNDMEDDIVDFLTSRLIAYEETDTSFVIQCPTCSTKECDSRVQGIFVDKNSG